MYNITCLLEMTLYWYEPNTIAIKGLSFVTTTDAGIMDRRIKSTAPPTVKTSMIQNTNSGPYFCLFFFFVFLYTSFEKRGNKNLRKEGYVLLEPAEEVLNSLC